MALRPKDFRRSEQSLRDGLIQYLDGELTLLSVSLKEVGIPPMVTVGLPLALPDDVAAEVERVYRSHDWLSAEYWVNDSGEGSTSKSRFEFELVMVEDGQSHKDAIRNLLWHRISTLRTRDSGPSTKFSVTASVQLESSEFENLCEEVQNRLGSLTGDDWTLEMRVIDKWSVTYVVSRS